jgi:hypothetical protein
MSLGHRDSMCKHMVVKGELEITETVFQYSIALDPPFGFKLHIKLIATFPTT